MLKPLVTIKSQVVSGTDIDLTSLKMEVDGSVVNPQIDVVNSRDIRLSYTGDFDDGEHIVKVYAKNVIELEEENELRFKTDNTSPCVSLYDPSKKIFVPQSEWPNGSYKNPINYQIPIKFGIEDNIAVNGSNVYIDEKLIFSTSGISSQQFVKFYDVEFSTKVNWGKHILKITSSDLVGNTTTYFYEFYILPERSINPVDALSTTYLIDFWYILVTDVWDIGQKFGKNFIEPWEQKKYPKNICWSAIEYISTIPVVGKILAVEFYDVGYLQGSPFYWLGSGIISKLEAEVKVYDYFDNVMWSGYALVEERRRLSMPKQISIDENMVLYQTLRIKAVETPGGSVGSYPNYRIYKMNTNEEFKFPNYYTDVGKVNYPGSNPVGVYAGSIVVVDKKLHTIFVISDDGKQVLKKIGENVLVSPIDVKKYGSYYFVSDKGLNSIVTFNEDGNYVSQISGFVVIGKMDIKDDKLYIIDEGDKNIKVYSNLSGNILFEKSICAGSLILPKDISLDATGKIYVADGDKVKVFTLEGNLIGEIKDFVYEGIDYGSITLADSVFVDEQNVVFIADNSTYSARILIYKPEVDKFVPVGVIPKYDIVQHPCDIFVDKVGVLYVCDDVAGKVVKYDLDDEASSVNPLVFSINFPVDKKVIREDDLVEDKLQITGSVSAEEFLNYKVSYGEGVTPSSWNELYFATTPVHKGILYSWNMKNLPEGIYSLKIEMDYKLKQFTGEEEVKHKEKIISIIVKHWDEFYDNFEETPQNLFWITEIPEVKSYPWEVIGNWGKRRDDKFDGECSIGVRGFTSSQLISPMIDLTSASDAMLCFWAKYNLLSEGGWYYGNHFCSYVQISIDGGKTWKDIEPIGGYPGVRPYIPTGTPYQPKPSFYGSCSDWTRFRFDLSSYAGKKVKIKFVYEAVVEQTYVSWNNMYIYIDDLCVIRKNKDVYVDTQPPGKISSVSSTTNDQLKLSWIVPGNDGYRFGIKNGKWQIVGNRNFVLPDIENAEFFKEINFNLAIPGQTTTYILAGLTPNISYYFYVRCVDEGGNVGEWSDGVVGVAGYFERIFTISGLGYRSFSISFFDFDKDGYIDIMVGNDIYKNDKTGKFNKLYSINLPEGFQTYSYIQTGDIDNDGLPDIVIANQSYGIRVFRQQSGNFMLSWKIDLKEEYSDLCLGDVNNDGFLDIICSIVSGPVKIYKSKLGKDFELVWISSFTNNVNKISSNISIGDFNNDGLLDILVGDTVVTKLYKNISTNEMINFELNYTFIGMDKVYICDFDLDSKLDVFLYKNLYAIKIYKNNSTEYTTAFTEIQNISDPQQLYYICLGDCNNDGYPDLLLGRREPLGKLYLNRQGIQFYEFWRPYEQLKGEGIKAKLVDFDNDGDLDLFLGSVDYITIFKSYVSEVAKNIPPQMADDENKYKVEYDTTTNLIKFCFPYAKDFETPSVALNYAIRIGTSSKEYSLLSGVYDCTEDTHYGFIKSSDCVKFLYRPPFELTNSTVYWQIKAVDSGFKESSWSKERMFVFKQEDTQPPTINIVSPKGGEKFIAGIDTVTIHFEVYDNFDKNPKVFAYFTNLKTSATVEVLNLQEVNLKGLENGFWCFTVETEDCYGNRSSSTTEKFLIINDILPPRTFVSFCEPKWIDNNGRIFVSSSTKANFVSEDDLVNICDETGLGVKETYFSIDISTSFAIFIDSFTISNEGIHEVYYYSVDIVGNKEKIKSLEIYVDTTPPISKIYIGEPKYIFNDKIWVTKETEFSLFVEDPISNNVVSGVKFIEYRVDNGSWIVYKDKFKVVDCAEGYHIVEYRGVDNVNNIETEKFLEVILDTSPPETSISLTGPRYNEYISSNSSFTLTATDRGLIPSGIKETRYWINNLPVVIYTTPFTLTAPDGVYTINYHSIDNVDNTEVVKSVIVKLDNTAPLSSLTIVGGKQYLSSEGKFYTSLDTGYVLTGIDPEINGVASGIAKIEYRIDNSCWMVYQTTITLAEGVHTIEYRAVDNLVNIEEIKSLTVYVDVTPPISKLDISGVVYQTQDKVYIRPDTNIILSAEDPVSGDVSSGVKEIRYLVDDLVFISTYQPVCFILPEGVHTIKYYAVDNVGNTEPINTRIFYVDATPPLTEIKITTPKCELHMEPQVTSHPYTVISSTSQISFIVVDPLVNGGVCSGVKETRYSILPVYSSTFNYQTDKQNNNFVVYYEPFHITGMDGNYCVKYYSVDNVQNIESTKSVILTLDNTAPVAKIVFPSKDAVGCCKIVNGKVSILGFADDLHFKYYKLEYTPIGTESWQVVVDKTYKVVKDTDVLGNWDTTNLAEGYYELRLLASDCVDNIAIDKVEVYVGKPKLLLTIDDKQFNKPSYIAVDNSDNIYVTDTNNDRVLKFDSLGNFVKQIGPELKKKAKGVSIDKLNKPTGIGVDSFGNIYVSDRNNDRVIKFDNEGNIVWEKRGFNKPHGISVDTQNNIFVADRNNNRIQKFDMEGNLLMEIKTVIDDDGLNKPQGVISVDRFGRIYVTDRNNDRIVIYSSTGTYIIQISSETAGFNKPDGIAINDLGYIYVCDTNNDMVKKLEPYCYNLAMSLYEFNKPAGITLDREGNIYIVDTNNDRILKYGLPMKNKIVSSISLIPKHTALNSDFYLDRVYVYPNPARCIKPTIHIEVGKADKVQIKIYNIAGELIHEADISNKLQIIDDRYVYEYSWDTSKIASGVYICLINAEKQGYNPIRVIKKFAIIK